jgi:hypothetical protein
VAGEREPQPELGVEHIVHVLAERAELVEAAAPPEGRGLWHSPWPDQPPLPLARVRRRWFPHLEQVVVRVCEMARACEPASVRAPERGHGRLERAWQVVVVAVDVGHDVAARALESLVERVGLAAILLADPPREPVRIGLDDLDGAVGGPAVDDHVLERLVALVEHRSQRSLEESRLVERRRDDRQLRPGHQAAVASASALTTCSTADRSRLGVEGR